MANKIKKLVDIFEGTRGYFFLARLCLKVGQDITKIKEDDLEQPELLEKVEHEAEKLGISRSELESFLKVS